MKVAQQSADKTASTDLRGKPRVDVQAKQDAVQPSGIYAGGKTRSTVPGDVSGHQRTYTALSPATHLQQSVGNQGVLRGLDSGMNPAALNHLPLLQPIIGNQGVVRRFQAKLKVNTPGDQHEQEADRVAEQVMRMPAPGTDAAIAVAPASSAVQRKCSCGGGSATTCDKCQEEEKMLQRSASAPAANEYAPPIVHEVLRLPGRPLDTATRAFMEPRFGHDFSKVRVHADGQAAGSARALNALAYTSGQSIVFGAAQYNPGNDAGRRLLAHELTHVVQQSPRSSSASPALQRKVILQGTEMQAKERTAFIKARKWTNAALAQSIMNDIADAGDLFDFADQHELEIEIRKRISTVLHMEETQKDAPGGQGRAFAYPFSESNQTELYGPRVNYAAREYWEPPVPGGYAARTDKAKNKYLLSLPRHRRCEVYGDQCGLYGWQLSAKGQIDPYQAVALLFTPQTQPRLRSLIHCDYLISLVNMMSLADALGQAEFNKRVKAFGTDKFFLNWNAFSNLHAVTWEMYRTGQWKPGPGNIVPAKWGLRSTQSVRPSSPADLVIGDHVIFENHLAYDLLNEGVGNAWRLENAVLIRRNPSDPKKDVFLGHGSGEQTAEAMQQKLAAEFQLVWGKADRLLKQAKSGTKKQQAAAWNQLNVQFKNVKWYSTGPGYPPVGDWTVQGYPPLRAQGGCSLFVVWKFFDLGRVRGTDVVGLKDPCNLTKLRTVERPIESAK